MLSFAWFEVRRAGPCPLHLEVTNLGSRAREPSRLNQPSPGAETCPD